MTAPVVEKTAARRRWRALMVIALLAVTGVAGYLVLAPGGSDRAEATAPQAPEPRAVSVSVVRTKRETVVERLPVTGTLVAREEIQIGPEIDGYRIAEIFVEEGDAVTKGQILARLARDMIDTQIAQNDAAAARARAAVAQAQASVEQAVAQELEVQAAVVRARTLRQTGATSQEVLDQRERAATVAAAQVVASRESLKATQADVQNVEAQRAELDVRLGRTEIRAPAAGIVSARKARIGAIVLSAGTEPLFRIIRDGAIDLDAEVPEAVLPRVAVGQSVAVTPAGFTAPLEGKVRLVGAQVDRTSRLARVAVAVPSVPELRPGTYGHGVIEVGRREGLALPISAVQFGADGAFVQVVDNGVVAVRPVKTGLRGEGRIEITQGLSEGDTVVARAGGFLREGDRVKPVEVDAAGGNS